MQAVDAFLPVIMLMEAGDDAIAAQAMQAGAHSVLVKTVLTPSLLHGAIASAIGHAALERQIDQQRTQIARAKRALARSDRLNEAIVNSAAYMVVATDIGGKILLFNPESERQLGYRAEDIVGQITPMAWLDAEEVAARAAEMGLGEAYEADFSVISRQAETEGVSRREWTCLRRNGESFTANFTVSALRDGQGPATGFLIVGEDITEAKRRQDTLRAREELFRGAMEHAPTGIALIDTGGRFLKVNAALCDMLGYAAGDLEGRHEHSVTDPEDIELDIEDARQLLAGKIAAYKVEKRLIRADGGVAYALQAMSLMRHEGGAPHYFVAQFQDIGDAKRAERHRSDFASLAGHQLRTPLTSIRGAVGLLAAVLGDALPPRGHQLLEIASRNCDRLVAVVNDLLTIDRMAQGEMRFEMRDEDAGALMLAAIEAHRPACQTLGVSVVMEPVPAGLMVHADGARLTQVMVNLLANAVRHSPEQGQIRVGAVRAESKLRLWVKDQGPGIAPEAAARIFDCPSADYEPARILDGPGQPSGKTSGLGLHVSRRIVEGMGGSIGVDSMPGVGSTFWVELPAREVEAETTPAAPVRRADGSTAKRILICEDDDNLAALIQLMLSRAGYAADVVHSVPEARRRLASGSYGAMTLDLTLPLGDGLDFARELRAAAATHDFPVIIVSGSNRDERASVPGDAGIVDWIVKPFDKERLVRSVEKAASTHLRLAHSA